MKQLAMIAAMIAAPAWAGEWEATDETSADFAAEGFTATAATTTEQQHFTSMVHIVYWKRGAVTARCHSYLHDDWGSATDRSFKGERCEIAKP